MNKKTTLISPLALATCHIALTVASAQIPMSEIEVSNGLLIDPHSTPETRALYVNVQQQAKKSLLYGVQRPFTRGYHNGDNEDFDDFDFDVSDLKDVCGEHPAVVGLDFLEHQSFDLPNELWEPRPTYEESTYGRIIKTVYSRGGVITMSWHMSNPKTGAKYWDRDDKKTVQYVLEGQIVDGVDVRANFYRFLDQAADFFKAMKDENGKLIPIFFRPLHEQYHDSFWWSGDGATVEQYNQLWYEMIGYLRDTREVRNLIYIISPNKTDKEQKYVEKFPGHNWVDAYGIDWYSRSNFYGQIERSSELIVRMAREHNKIAVLTEIGVKGGMTSETSASWYSIHALQLKDNPVASEVAWFHQWSSKIYDFAWSPVKKSFRPDLAHTIPDFLKFYNDEWTVFADGMPALGIYDFKADSPVPIITTTNLKSVSNQENYSERIRVTGGDGALTWSLEDGELPPGLTLNKNTGQISGTVNGSGGEYGIAIRVTDADGDSDVRIYAINVWPSGDQGSELVMHLDATVKSSVVGNPVTRWKDQSGNKNHGNLEAGSITYPSTETFASELSGVDFGSAASALELFNAKDSDIWLDQSGQNPQGFAVLMAYKRMGSNANGRQDILGNESNTKSGFLVRTFSGTIQSALNGKTLSQSGSVAEGNSVVLGINYHAGTGLFELWDSLSGSTSRTTVSPADFSKDAPVLLGMTNKPSRYLDGLVGEVKVFNGSLSTQAFASEQEVLVQKWATGSVSGPGAAELVLHLNATDASSVVGNPVSQWSDLSGLGNHATPSKGAVTYPSVALFPSGLTGIDFGSGRNSLELFDVQESDGLLDQTGSDGFAVFLTYRKTGNETDQQDLLGNVSKTDASENGGFVVRLSSGGVLRAMMGDASLSSAGDNLKIGDSMVIGIRYLADAGLLELYNSLGDTVDTATAAAADFSNSSPLTLGSANKQSRYAMGVIGEVKIFSGAMDSDVFQSELSALNSKWITNETDYWASGLGFDIGGEDEDFDGDGVSNFIEYVFGGSPMDSSVQMFPVRMKNIAGTLLYSHARRINSNGLIYQVQTSSTLEPGSWRDINPVINNVTPLDDVFEEIDYEFPSGEDALFIRVKATK
ncbi:MAG: glycosyl hydrolase [Verrucomicrobiota bacterium]